MASQPGQDQDNLHLICVCLSPNCLFYVLVQQRGTHFEPAGDILICAKGIVPLMFWPLIVFCYSCILMYLLY